MAVKDYGAVLPAAKVSLSSSFRSVRKASPPLRSQLRYLIFGSYINLLLLVLPFAFVYGAYEWNPSLVFITNFITLVPLASLLGTLTEEVALHSNPSIAALINVTFGNATELIVSIVALRVGAYDVIRYSLVGSILGNMLLVLGCSLIANGWTHNVDTFNTQAVNVYESVLVLSTLSFIIPTAFAQNPKYHEMVLPLSRQLAVVCIVMYCAYLSFQLYTHKYVFETDDEEAPCVDDEGPKMSLWFAIISMGIVGAAISFGSDYIVGSIEGTVDSLHLSRHFVGVILLPIVGNAAEHITAITQAYKGNLDIAFGIAVGSSIQISCFVVPFIVLLGYAWDLPMNMDFHPFQTIAMFCSVVALNTLTGTGRSHWLTGIMLICAYVMLSLAFLMMPDQAKVVH